MKGETSQTFKKKIKDYIISYCSSEYYGKNLHGQLRVGYNKENKVILFRINELPLTPNLMLFLELQQHLSDLSGFSRTIYQSTHTSAHSYQPVQYFPRTFHSEINTFRSNHKYMDEYVQKFLRVYAFFYNMKVAHGNLSPQNIGISFDGKIKLMDFGCNFLNESFQKRAQKDFQNFKHFISVILQKDSNYPAKFSSFNNPSNQNWQHLFSLWHITSPLQPLYFRRKSYIDNIVTLLYKLYNDFQQKQISPSLLFGLRLLMLKYLKEGQQQQYESQKQELESIVGELQDWDLQKFNSVIVGAIQDSQYYEITTEHRLILICCLIPEVNHQYAFFEIVNEFNSTEKRRNQLLGDSLFITYRSIIFSNLLKPSAAKIVSPFT